MNYMINSNYAGIVKAVNHGMNDYVYEWEPLIIIETLEGTLIFIKVGYSGRILDIFTHVGAEIVPGSALCSIKDDLVITGSD